MGGGGSKGPSAAEVKAKQDASYYKGKSEGLEKLNAQYSRRINQNNEQIANNARQMQQLLKELQNIKDPSQMAIKVQQMKDFYWNDLRKQKFQLLKGKSVIFIGRTNAGKSSLLNLLFKANQAVSKLPCTSQIQIVQKLQHISIFDCPGLDTHFDLIKQPQKIPKYLGCMAWICYLYTEYPEPDIIKTFMAMGKKILAVRTKCDPNDNLDQNAQCRKYDQDKLKQMGCNAVVYLTSKFGGADNQKLLKAILEQ